MPPGKSKPLRFNCHLAMIRLRYSARLQKWRTCERIAQRVATSGASVFIFPDLAACKEIEIQNSLSIFLFAVPPSAPVIKNELDVVVPSVAGPYLEGHTLKLVCESSTGTTFDDFFVLVEWRGLVHAPSIATINTRFRIVKKMTDRPSESHVSVIISNLCDPIQRRLHC